MPGQMAGNGALSRTCRAVNGDDDLPAGFRGAQGAFFRAHARFFVSCLGRAVMPNRLCLLIPALAPEAPRRAGLRLLREFALGLAAALAWPLRWPHDEAEDFADRVPEAPLAVRVALPFDRAPLLEPAPACAPLRLAFIWELL